MLPIVEGLTERSDSGDSMISRIAKAVASSQVDSSSEISAALDHLHRASTSTSNDELRSRLEVAMSLIHDHTPKPSRDE